MQQQLNEREEIEALLAWFVTRRLGPDDMARVQRYLDANPAMQAELTFARGEMAETIATAEASGAPGPQNLDRLMREVSAMPPSAGSSRATAGLGQLATGLLERLAGWLASLSPVQLGGMATAASLIIALQAGSLLFLSGADSPRIVYETASGPRDANPATGTFAIIAFKPGAAAGAIAALFEGARAEIVEGPKAGIWRVRLARDVKSSAEAEALLARLGARTDLVSFTALAQ